MSSDTLSDLLRAVRLRGAVFFHVEGAPPWGASAPDARAIRPSILPDAEHMMMFHAVVEGSCWAGIIGEPAVQMSAGDVILFPQGDAHLMSSAPEMPSVDVSVFFAPHPPKLPYAIRVNETNVTMVRPTTCTVGGAIVVCGFLGLDARPFNPLLAALPRQLHVTGSTLGAGSWVTTLMSAVAAESNSSNPGRDAVLERMSEMLFVEVLRRYVDTLPAEQTGWLAGMRDPAVGRALSLIHECPAEPWTLERLGEEAGLSRSTLHDRFVHFIEQPPMQYLTQWRMQVASGKLRDTNAKLIDVALDVGYESEAAFSRAFKRVAGVSPGTWRKELRKSA